MSPSGFYHAQFGAGLRNYAIPVLEAYAENDYLRNCAYRRFERDEPPPYTSSTESGEPDDGDLTPPRKGPLPEDLRAIMERPIEDIEFRRITDELYGFVTARECYYAEVTREEDWLLNYRPFETAIFTGSDGIRRLGVMARHSVKRRWEKLGIWNPEWGFPGRNMRPGDYIRKWRWRWQQHDVDDSGSGDVKGPTAEELVARALRLRQNLRRGEKAPAIPRSHLEPDATAFEAESFLISRPWFVFRLEVAEECERYRRLSFDDQRRYPRVNSKQVIEWWKERGDWREEFDRTEWVTSWKWRHESPSPEPEDLTPIANLKDRPMKTADIDFTPSEIDDLETIELPSPEQPEYYWEIGDEDAPPYFPGQRYDVSKQAERAWRQRVEEARRDGALTLSPRVSPLPQRYLALLPLLPTPVKGASSNGNENTVQELEDNICKPQQDTSSLLTPNPRQNPDPDHPPLRRSARIAGTKRSGELLLSHTAPNQKTRGRTALSAVAPTAQRALREIRHTKTKPVSAGQSSKYETATRRKQGRRLPTKENWPGTRSAIAKRIPATSASARTRRGGAVAAGALAISRPQEEAQDEQIMD